MDFEKLSKIVNKDVIKWTIQDVSKWLSFIGLDTLQSNFRASGVDGSILEELEMQDLETQLNIKSNIKKKKIMNWVKNGFKQFSNYLQTSNKENIGLQKNSSSMDIQEINKQQENIAINSNLPKVQKINQLIIAPQQGTQSPMFCITEEGGKIGRHSSNNILIIQESVSRYHAQIKYDKKKELFLINDLKSSTGTFLKIQEKLVLKKGTIVEAGSYQFLVESITIGNDSSQLTLRIIQGNPLNKQIKLIYKLGQNYTFKIGRKESNQIFFEDTHLSGVHAVITYINGKFTIQDMNSTNGTWLRIDQQSIYLTDSCVFKIGSVSIYKCKYNHQKKAIQPIRSENCIICYQNDRDSLYLPCKHNLVCLRCSKNVKQCPACRQKIQDIIKIYK